MGLLTDTILKYILGALSAALLLVLVQQEISLRHALSATNRSLDSEIQCRVGSTCAQKAHAAAEEGAALVQQARADAAAALASQKAALDQQAMDAVRKQQEAQAALKAEALSWQQKYDSALAAPACAAWAKQVNPCAIH